jgi:hypothetical protein
MWHALERREKCTDFLKRNSEGKTPLERPRRGWGMGSEWIFGDWSGFRWLRIGTGGGLL